MPPKSSRFSMKSQPRPILPVAVSIAKVRKYDNLTFKIAICPIAPSDTMTIFVLCAGQGTFPPRHAAPSFPPGGGLCGRAQALKAMQWATWQVSEDSLGERRFDSAQGATYTLRPSQSLPQPGSLHASHWHGGLPSQDYSCKTSNNSAHGSPSSVRWQQPIPPVPSRTWCRTSRTVSTYSRSTRTKPQTIPNRYCHNNNGYSFPPPSR